MPGIILLSHPVHDAITDTEMRAALGPTVTPTTSARVEPARLTLAETDSVNWAELARGQKALVEGKLLPLIKDHPDYEVAYFGLAPIPLAIHLGSLVDRWRPSRVYQRHHADHSWAWRAGAESPVALVDVALPGDIVRSEDDVIVRVSVTARVDVEETRKVVSLTSAEIDVGVATPGEDVLKTAEDLEALAGKVKEALDRLKTHRPNARHIHLFAAVPAGLAFRLGTLISSTQHHRVQTYQYAHRADPKHRRAILIGDDGPRVRELTSDDRTKADATRRAWAVDLTRAKAFATNIKSRAARSPDDRWFDLIDLPLAPWGDSWKRLAPFHETAMAGATVAATSVAAETGFRYREPQEDWIIGDDLVSAISARVPSNELNRAGRMLLFHEAVHIRTHRLTEATAPAIRRFPKIVEAVDYEADVWAMLHELAFTRTYFPDDGVTDKAIVLDIVGTAIETMWAFDDGLDELGRMEVRRVNRYLIWYWQVLRLERCSSLPEIVAILANKPLIELAGPRVHVDGDRVFYELRAPWAADLEIAVQLHHGGIVRHGRGASTDVPALIDGLRRRKGELLKAVIKGIVDQEVSR